MTRQPPPPDADRTAKVAAAVLFAIFAAGVLVTVVLLLRG
ncbi:hypothetical protein OEIGOIKO_06220 [Streptomyces chrestomyceticus JCM 4735]|uniref:Uncharacterized protein n=1 Tax=Streptomyces chrestomyceticus JCM 4735 TaxID=1306181 RepID=A0A7U9PZF5_9ACTN|nr:hypothetical protein OEIGOIKO_06220 [Streptomyces chrestomyceticus JCM 4735]